MVFEGFSSNTPSTPLHWSRYPTAESKPVECVGFEFLERKIEDLLSWSKQHNKEIVFVSALVATRNGPNGLEILLVQGRSKETGELKAWQTPGGKYDQARGDRNHFETCQNELSEELGVYVPESAEYMNTYVELNGSSKQKVLAIHNFRLHNCEWTDKELEAHTSSHETDVAQHEWTSDPFRNADGTERVLTPQTRHTLIKLGFKPPTPLPEDKYNGDPENI